MEKKIGVLAAVAFVLGTQGVTAASISPSRLEELMSSTSQHAVSLETLRARDRVILEKLATSLANRYSDLLAGSELVFTRLSEAGSVFYRLDFVNLQNRDRARALCEILEMERCVARVGDDRLSVLHVQSGSAVTAIAVVEKEEEEPFSFFAKTDAPKANPVAKDVERRVRAMLDPLEAVPEPRPDFSKLNRPVDEEQPSALPTSSAQSAENAPEDWAEDTLDQAVAVAPEEAAAEVTVDAAAQGGEDQPAEGLSGQIIAPAAMEEPVATEPQTEGDLTPGATAGEIVDEALIGPVDEVAPDEGIEDALPKEPPAAVEVMGSEEPIETPAPLEEEDLPHDLVPQGDVPQDVSEIDQQAGLTVFPLARDEALAPIMAAMHPVPTQRPVIELARVTHPMPELRPELVAKLSPVFPLARPELSDKTIQHTAQARLAAPVRRAYFELADTGSFAELAAMSKKASARQQTAFSIPDAASLDFSSLSGLAPKIAPARVEAPAVKDAAAPAMNAEPEVADALAAVPAPADKTIAPVIETISAEAVEVPTPLSREIALAGVQQTVLTEVEQELPLPMARDLALASISAPDRALAKALETGPVPDPMLRDIALAEMRERQQAREFQMAGMLGEAAPKPLLRSTAMARVSPKVDTGYMVAKIDAPTMQAVNVDLPKMTTSAEAPRVAPSLEGEQENFDVAMSPPPLPERRPHFEAPQPVQVAAAERARPEFPEGELVVAGMEVAQLGKVSFDDRFAKPAHVDFADGEMAGRLQKLPLKRPDFAGREARASFVARMIREDGDFGAVAMTSRGDGAFEVAQVPSMPTASEAVDAPFKMVEEPARDQSSSLDLFFESPQEEAPAVGDAEVGRDAFSLSQPAKMPVLDKEDAASPTPTVVPPKRLNLRPSLGEQPIEVTQPEASIVAPKAAPSKPVIDQAALEAEIELRKLAEEQARQRKVLAVMSEIIAQREAKQPEASLQETAAPVAPQRAVKAPDPAVRAEAPAQRRPAPRGPLSVNQDKDAARELAGYEAGFSDDRSKMQRAAHPQGQPSGVQLREQGRAMDMAKNQGLRIELSYVSSRQEVMSRVAELKTFFPAIMLEKGRFFGASIPEQPHRYMVGFAAEDDKARDDIIWYLEQMGMPWAIRD